MRLGLMIGAALSLVACADAGVGGDGDYMDDDLPMGNCGGSGTGGACPQDSGNVPAGLPCGATQDCDGDLSCVAPFANDQVGDFTCSAQCIPLEDEAWWCLDASGCCDPSAVCTPRGLCVIPTGVDDTAGDDSGTTDATSTTSDASSTGSESTGSESASTGATTASTDDGTTTDADASSTGAG